VAAVVGLEVVVGSVTCGCGRENTAARGTMRTRSGGDGFIEALFGCVTVPDHVPGHFGSHFVLPTVHRDEK
jgi:hypothetical protein